MAATQPSTRWVLMENRSCGTCTVCCTVPAIDDALISKASNTTCRYCRDNEPTGCSVYDTRPNVCRDFYCAWRLMPDIPEAWRPDRSGVFATIDDSNIPGYGVMSAVTLMLIGDPLHTMRQHWFQAYVRARALQRQPMFLALPGKPGTKPVRAHLPMVPLFEAATRGTPEVKALLEQALKLISTAPLAAFTFRQSGVDVSAG